LIIGRRYVIGLGIPRLLQLTLCFVKLAALKVRARRALLDFSVCRDLELLYYLMSELLANLLFSLRLSLHQVCEKQALSLTCLLFYHVLKVRDLQIVNT
jgi:hypothetical protein